MKRFFFRLQRILDILLKRLEQKKIELLNITQELRRKEEEISSQKKSIVETQQSFHNQMIRQELRPGDFICYENYIEVQYIKLKELFQQRMEIQKRLDRCKEEYIEINKSVKTFEKLKEKQFTKYMFEYDLAERKDMDEIAIRRVSFAKIHQEGEST